MIGLVLFKKKNITYHPYWAGNQIPRGFPGIRSTDLHLPVFGEEGGAQLVRSSVATGSPKGWKFWACLQLLVVKVKHKICS